MNRVIGLQLVIYSLLLVGLSYVAHRLAPEATRAMLATNGIGGALCLIWGIRALSGSRRKVWAMLTLVPVAFLLLARTVIGWTGGDSTAPSHGLVVTITTVLLVLSLTMLIRIAYAGVLGEGLPPGPTGAGRTPSGVGDGGESGNHANKRA